MNLLVRDVQHTDRHVKVCAIPPPSNFTVSYLKSELYQRYSFRYETAKFDNRKRAAKTLKVCRMQSSGRKLDINTLNCFKYIIINSTSLSIISALFLNYHLPRTVHSAVYTLHYTI